MKGRTKVVAIIGWTRSGSTLLDNTLGGIDGIFSTGELSFLWERGLVEQRLCSCGRPVPRCRLWTSVLEKGFGDDLPDPQDVMRWQTESTRVRYTRRLLQLETLPSGWPSLDAYASVATSLYRAIREVTGARVLVDSSKRPSTGALLSLLPDIDPYVVHLVRDPRAVAYSWHRRQKLLDRTREQDRDEAPRYSAVYSTLGWAELNVAAELVRRSFGRERSMRLRYEDFVRRPRDSLGKIVRMVGEDPTTLPLANGHEALISPHHAVSGNPSRFTTGRVPLRLDEEWKTHMRTKDRYVATALALPLLARYGYWRS